MEYIDGSTFSRDVRDLRFVAFPSMGDLHIFPFLSQCIAKIMISF